MAISGQQIGANKSDIWFSSSTPTDKRQVISNMFSVSQDSVAHKYLGSPISNGTNVCDFLIESFASRLNYWNSKLLSLAGRVILIKSILQSISVYYMSTRKIP